MVNRCLWADWRLLKEVKKGKERAPVSSEQNILHKNHLFVTDTTHWDSHKRTKLSWQSIDLIGWLMFIKSTWTLSVNVFWDTFEIVNTNVAWVHMNAITTQLCLHKLSLKTLLQRGVFTIHKTKIEIWNQILVYRVLIQYKMHHVMEIKEVFTIVSLNIYQN